MALIPMEYSGGGLTYSTVATSLNNAYHAALRRYILKWTRQSLCGVF